MVKTKISPTTPIGKYVCSSCRQRMDRNVRHKCCCPHWKAWKDCREPNCMAHYVTVS